MRRGMGSAQRSGTPPGLRSAACLRLLGLGAYGSGRGNHHPEAGGGAVVVLPQESVVGPGVLDVDRHGGSDAGIVAGGACPRNPLLSRYGPIRSMSGLDHELHHARRGIEQAMIDVWRLPVVRLYCPTLMGEGCLRPRGLADRPHAGAFLLVLNAGPRNPLHRREQLVPFAPEHRSPRPWPTGLCCDLQEVDRPAGVVGNTILHRTRPSGRRRSTLRRATSLSRFPRERGHEDHHASRTHRAAPSRRSCRECAKDVSGESADSD